MAQGNGAFQLVIRFNDDSPDLTIPLQNFHAMNTTVLKKQIREAKPELSRKNLKLIYSGKILNHQTNFENDIARLIRLSNNTDELIKVYIHCLIGEALTDEELAEEESLQALQQERRQQFEQNAEAAPVGFDRLLAQGFSAQDVADLRRQFQSIYGSGGTESAGPGSGQPRGEDLRQLEERWMDSTVNNEIDEFQNLTTSSIHDTNVELLLGIIIGSLLGVLALFLLKLDFLNLSKRSKVAIMAGVIVNFSFAVVRAWT